MLKLHKVREAKSRW